jgi:hypothetical protein
MTRDTTNNFSAPVRTVDARVELYEGDTLADAYTKYYALKELTIDRVGESKFFGFGICQRLNVHLVDKDRLMHITTADNLRVFLTTGGSNVNSFPLFYVSEVHRDENTNELSVTAYDGIYKATEHTVAELGLVAPYTLFDVIEAVSGVLGLASGVGVENLPTADLATGFADGANFDGTENLREVLNWIAEALQAVYYLTPTNNLAFKRLDVTGEPVFEITKEDYFTLDSGDNRRLATIAHVTELGDNVSATTGATGSTQYVRNNPFWDMREDIATILNNAIAAVGGLTINQFSCSWRGIPLVEIGDKIRLTTKDNGAVISYLLNDTIAYNGALEQATEWVLEDDSADSEDNPASLGEALKQTYARVDKANKEIALVASDMSGAREAISALQVNTEGIVASVKSVKETTEGAIGGLNDDVANLTTKVNAAITSQDVQLQIETELANGVDKVVTSTGFTFNDEGLTVSKSDSEMQTTITEDGMRVYRNEEAVLVADNEGVKAEDLHATTYLIVGTNSRFEDYLENRTGCFWIGGS